MPFKGLNQDSYLAEHYAEPSPIENLKKRKKKN